MSPNRRRRAVVAISALVTGVAVASTIPYATFASHGGIVTRLSATGNGPIKWADGGAALAIADTAVSGAWSPDGSRFAFADTAGNIETVRYDNSADTTLLRANTAGHAAEDAAPTWTSDGSVVVWAQNVGIGSTLGWARGDLTHAGDASGDGGVTGVANLPATMTYTHPDGGPSGMIVFQALVNGQTQPGIYRITESQLSTASVVDPSLMVTNAASPSIAPEGDRIAWVRPDTDGHKQIWVSDLTGGSAVALTSSATDHDNPTWSPDGSTIAFASGGDIFTIAADGSQPAGPTVVSGLHGMAWPAYQTASKDVVFRLFGHDRFGTAIATSQSQWANYNTSDGREAAKSVVLSRSDTFADALGGSALAAAKQGPLLMTAPDVLNAATATEIRRVIGNSTTDPVYILGSPGAISTTVENSVKAMGYHTVRLAGQNRFGTAVAIAQAINPHPSYVLAATGMDFPDALGASAAAAAYDVPGSGTSAVVVLTADGVLPTETQTYLNSVTPPHLYAIGSLAATALGTGHYTSKTVAGHDRYSTSVLVAQTFFAGANYVGIATGTNWPDALAGGALMGTLNGPLLLTDPANAAAVTTDYLRRGSGGYHTAVIFGSATGAVSDDVAGQIGTAISGPVGYTVTSNPQAGPRPQIGPRPLAGMLR